MLDAAYSLQEIRDRSLEASILARDLDGYFDHVWSVHPLIGADPNVEVGVVKPGRRIERLAERHTIIEGSVGDTALLQPLPMLNLLISQSRLFLRLVALMRSEAISLVRTGDPYYLGVLGLALARSASVPLVVRVNGNYDAIYASTGRIAYPRLFRRRRIEKAIERYVFRHADLIAGANRDALDFALNNGAPKSKSAVFPYGNLIHPAHHSDPAKRCHNGRHDRSPILIAITRLEPVKRPGDTLDVLRRVRQSHPDTVLMLVGDGSMHEELELRCGALGISSAVRFVGNQDQEWIATALRDASVVLAPMAGRALVEAALSGTPIVAYDIDWHGEFIASGKNGVLVPFGDVTAMAKATEQLLDDPATAALLGRNARESALTVMNPSALSDKERAYYEALLSSEERGYRP
ncbi:MAG TPA: glycosyltransferase family 4 protein [Acidimicrobiales bacterium]|nr:glycosyltransferase family 4 protein [Acidimicrobiales bacterium]